MIAAAHTLAERIRAEAHQLGFDPVGITALGPAATHRAFLDWLDRGFAGEMSYLERGAAKRADSRLPFEGVRTAVVVGLDYGGRQPGGPIARYARGNDYHDVMLERLRALHRFIETEAAQPIRGKAYVDTGPILERDLAQRAGLGWIGKNTMLINPARGSFFFLGALLVDLDLPADPPFAADRCGTCTRCLDACPTGAIVAPRVLDARRCISYLTIEHRSAIDPALHTLLGDWLYGCDICQDVCPWNVRFARPAEDAALAPRPENVAPDIDAIAALDPGGFRARFRGSPITRARHAGITRNARIVLANRARRRRALGEPDGTELAAERPS